jgi:hypothetical protein
MDWIGQFVILLNPQYRGDCTEKKKMAFSLMTIQQEEMLLPVPPSKLRHLEAANRQAPKRVHIEASFDRAHLVLGGNAFNIQTDDVTLISTYGIPNACANPHRKARHIEGTKCVFPTNRGKSAGVINYPTKVELPGYRLGTVEVSCAWQFCCCQGLL